MLFPIREVLAVRNSTGDVTYENGKDFVWKADSREIVIPVGSRIPSKTPAELRRPAKTQKYELTHRDGNGEIFFGSRLEYAEMQTCITYRHEPDLWKSAVPKFDPLALPRSVGKLVNRQPLSIVVVGDSISAGCNASGWAEGAPFQPACPELVQPHLEARFRNQANTEAVIAKIRERLPDVEFILVASMRGNRDWTRLKLELFPEYRDALAKLCGPGVALADLTSIWTDFLELKKDWDQTGNGVNHPNDFGHRVHAQVITTLLDPRGEPSAVVEPPQTIEAGPLKFIEQRLLGN